jgi:hypothetical protein
MGDLRRGLGVDPEAGRGRGSAASGGGIWGIGRSTVERALASDRPPRYEQAAVSTSFTSFQPMVRQLLVRHPDMPAAVIAERVG